MAYSIRTFPGPGKFCQQLRLEALASVIPEATVRAVLAAGGALGRRERRLTMPAVVWALLALALYPRLGMGAVLATVARGLRYVWPDPDAPMPGASALSYRRYQLGARPLVALFRRVCRPLATPATPGAFLCGRRLLAVDGTVEDVPDTPANARAFGRHTSGRGAGAFPQVLGVYLVECGTHAVVDAGFWPCHTSERVGGFRLLRSVGPGDLLLWDRNFHSYAMVAATLARGADLLGRLPAGAQPEVARALPDGSQLVWLRPGDPRQPGERRRVRLIRYTLADPARAGCGEVHRLSTTLLDPAEAPALDLICAYHARWEAEVTIDEVDTHLRQGRQPLRSQRPVGVIQELYALLLAHYAVRALMHQAARQAGWPPVRLSFVHAVRVLHDALPEFQLTAPADHPRLYARLLADLVTDLLPPRRERSYPRVVKRKMSKFPLKRDQHRQPPPLAGPFRDSVVLI